MTTTPSAHLLRGCSSPLNLYMSRLAPLPAERQASDGVVGEHMVIAGKISFKTSLR
jgi:hypothetical protein